MTSSTPRPSRRQFLQTSAAVTAAAGTSHFASAAQNDNAKDPLAIGSRRELFVDRTLIETLSGGAAQRVQQPVPREIAL